MSRFSSLILTAALLGVVVTVAVQGQAPEGGRGQGGGGQQAVTLPDSAGKDIVQAACTKCHGLNQITGSVGYTREKWQELFATMIKLPDVHRRNEGIPPAAGQPYGIDVNSQGVPWVAYNRSYKVASLDPVTMAVREYPLPDQRSTVRRIAMTRDDMVWYVNSSLGRLGRLNPKTGEIKEWPSPSGPDTNPYAIAVVNDIIWYNESRRRPDTLVRFDPKTEKFQSWAIPSGVGTLDI